jgi:hypothetical protein
MDVLKIRCASREEEDDLKLETSKFSPIIRIRSIPLPNIIYLLKNRIVITRSQKTLNPLL